MSKLTEKDVEAIRIRARDTDDLLTDISKDYPQINEKNISLTLLFQASCGRYLRVNYPPQQQKQQPAPELFLLFQNIQ